jgi:hypothetical protein
MANVYDISIEQGSSLNLSLSATDSDGAYLNFSGYAARGKIKYGYGSSSYLLNINPQIDPSLVSGLINISLTADQTSLLPVTKAVYDIEIYTTGAIGSIVSGYTFKVLKGYADISPEVTTS